MTRVGLLLASGLMIAAATLLTGCDQAPPPPPQPIAYNHKVHIDEGLTCDRCHRGATETQQAGLPGIGECLACHRRAIPDHPEIIKLAEYGELGVPLMWRKVNVMPASATVHFDHAAHMRAEMECQTCHGPVEEMALAERVIDTANMGWCIDCHIEKQASIDCLTCHH